MYRHKSIQMYGCAFCTELRRIGLQETDQERYHAAVEDLFARAARARKARQLYGHRKGHHR